MKQINLYAVNYKEVFKWLGWVVAIAILLFLWKCNPGPNNSKETELKNKIHQLSQMSLELAKIADSLTAEIENKKGNIVIINREKNEKILSIDTLTVSEYQQFFAERYPR
jgi:hypothetical protein